MRAFQLVKAAASPSWLAFCRIASPGRQQARQQPIAALLSAPVFLATAARCDEMAQIGQHDTYRQPAQKLWPSACELGGGKRSVSGGGAQHAGVRAGTVRRTRTVAHARACARARA